MKILIVTGAFPPMIGGPATNTYEIAKRLGRAGHIVKILTYGSSNSRVYHKMGDFQICRVPFHRLLIVRLVLMLSTGIVVSRDSDVIYSQGIGGSALISSIISVLMKKPLAIRVVGDLAWEFAFKRKLTRAYLEDFQINPGSFRAKLVVIFRNMLSRRASKIIVPSRYLMYITKDWNSKITPVIIRNAIDFDFCPEMKYEESQQRLNLQGRIVLSVGRLVPWKGFQELLLAFKLVQDDIPNLKLVIIGSGPLETTLKTQAVDLGIRDKVRFTGILLRDDIALYMKAADIFVLNSKYEGMSHTLLEAMLCSVPVVCRKNLGNLEIVRDGQNGFIVESGDPEELYQILRKLLENNNLAKSCAETARKLVLKKFNVKNMVLQVEKHLAILVQHSSNNSA